MSNNKPYYTLLIQYYGVWTIQFGDYERNVVEQEYRDSYGRESSHYPPIPRKRMKIIRTKPVVRDIDAAVDQPNTQQITH